MPKRDINQIAFDIVQQATGEIPKREPTARQENARKGGLKGGAKRMGALSAEERTLLAKKAAEARWKK